MTTKTSGLVGKVCCAGYGIHSAECPRVLLYERKAQLRECVELMGGIDRMHIPAFLLAQWDALLARLKETL